MAAPKVFKGIGIVHARRRSVPGSGFRDLGDVETLKLAHRNNQQVWKQHRIPGGGNLATLDTPDGVSLDVQMQEWTDENMAMTLQGKVVDVESETVTGEEIVLAPGMLSPTEFPGAGSVVITKTEGSTPIPLSAVRISPAGITVPAGSTVITVPTPATIAYVSKAAKRIEPLVEAGEEYELLFDGLNEAEGNRPCIVRVYRWKAPPAEELALIDAENPGKLLAKGEVLADPSVPPGQSPFYSITWL
ncbi:hypothetical protein VUJ49_22720 [Pseudomonas berkeleyensis]|uniref:Uncharacterized protein n=1 Tax=Pseudomonas berkeleyensis TaxID=2726956 RepID=A0A7G5DM11_9PSED|nr:hypothetical protein [Pseudomonas berkeleyensis]QMV62786.1 hypothetical protein HS968_22625 [Pseudomonas berkeleyensis]WSO38236.1 hypothetical protein VUJ49_22720 [Pseudomonas berkeleyensis]